MFQSRLVLLVLVFPPKNNKQKEPRPGLGEGWALRRKAGKSLGSWEGGTHGN